MPGHAIYASHKKSSAEFRFSTTGTLAAAMLSLISIEGEQEIAYFRQRRLLVGNTCEVDVGGDMWDLPHEAYLTNS